MTNTPAKITLAMHVGTPLTVKEDCQYEKDVNCKRAVMHLGSQLQWERGAHFERRGGIREDEVDGLHDVSGCST